MLHIQTLSPSSRTCQKAGLVGEIIVTWYEYLDWFLKVSVSYNINPDSALSLQAYRETHEDVWLEYAVSCFLQGVKFGIPNSRSHLARVLYLLSFDTPSEPVGRAFDKYLDQIPNWVWLSWIPQLLLSLQRTEAPHCKLVLLKVASVYPQVDVIYNRSYSIFSCRPLC